MSCMINVNEFVYILDKLKDDAIQNHRNNAYVKGLRDAQKIAQGMQTNVDDDETVIPVVGGIPREGTWWYDCGKCHRSIDYKDEFCRHCGRRLNWNDESIPRPRS